MGQNGSGGVLIILIISAPLKLRPYGAIQICLLLLLFFLNLGRSSWGGRQKLILEIIALMVNHPSGSHQQSSRAAG